MLGAEETSTRGQSRGEGAVAAALVIRLEDRSLVHLDRLTDFLDTSKLVLSGEMAWEGLVGNDNSYASSAAAAFELSTKGLFAHYGAVCWVMIHREKDLDRVTRVKRVQDDMGRRDADVEAGKVAADRAKRVAEESNRKRAVAVWMLRSIEVEKAELAKQVDKWKMESAQLREENGQLHKAIENACRLQAEDVKKFLDSAEGSGLVGEMRLSGRLDLLEKIQRRYPEFVFNLEDLVADEEDADHAEEGRGQPEQVPAEEQTADPLVVEPVAEGDKM